MMSQHSNSLVAATVAHNENLLRLCTIMAAVSMAKGCMQMLYCVFVCGSGFSSLYCVNHTCIVQGFAAELRDPEKWKR